MAGAVTREYGGMYRIKVSDGQASPAFLTLGGEGTFSVKRSADKIDQSSKDDANVKASGFGQSEISISVQGKVRLPDAGVKQVDSISKTPPREIEFQIVRGTTVVFRCLMGVGGMSADYANNAAVPYSFDLTAVADPTIDALFG